MDETTLPAPIFPSLLALLSKAPCPSLRDFVGKLRTVRFSNGYRCRIKFQIVQDAFDGLLIFLDEILVDQGQGNDASLREELLYSGFSH